MLTGEIPPRLRAIVGDIIHNARSSLDTVAVAVCEFGNGGQLSESDEGSVQFPITDSPASFDTAVVRRLPYAKDEHIEFIRTRQPWYLVHHASVLDDEQRKESITHDNLSTLQRFSNTDKHRRIHLTAWYPSDIYAGSNDTVTVGWRPNHPGRPWQHGDVIGWWILDGPDADVEELCPTPRSVFPCNTTSTSTGAARYTRSVSTGSPTEPSSPSTVHDDASRPGITTGRTIMCGRRTCRRQYGQPNRP